MENDYLDRFARSLGIFTSDHLKQIQGTKIGIGGLGLGGSIFINLVRMGFTQFHVSDPDIYEKTNINRQRMAKDSCLGQRKDDSLIKEARDINPDIEIHSFPEGINAQNVDAFVSGLDWIIDVVDVFALEAKILLNEKARENKIPLISAGSLGFAASLIVFDHSGPSFVELTGMNKSLDPSENLQRFARFIAPEIPSYMAEQLEKALVGKGHIPFLVPGVEITAALVCTEVGKRILGLADQIVAPYGMYFDPACNRYETFHASHYGKLKVAS